MAVAVLVDTSASVSPQDLARASEFASALDKARGRHWVRVLPFARSVRDLGARGAARLAASTHGRRSRTRHRSRIRHRRSHQLASLRTWCRDSCWFPTARRTRAASLARPGRRSASAFPSTPSPMQGRPQPSLRLESVTVPTVAFTGEQFPVDLSIASPSAVSGSVQISAEGKVLGSNPVKLEKGDNQVRVHASLTAAGALSLTGVIQANGLGDIRFDRAVTLRRPKVLYISQDPAGTEAHLIQTLTAAQFDVDRTADPAHGIAGRLPIGGLEQSGSRIAAGRAKGRDREVRPARRRTAGDRGRAQHLRRQQESGRRAGPHSARQARSAAIARRHRGGH